MYTTTARQQESEDPQSACHGFLGHRRRKSLRKGLAPPYNEGFNAASPASGCASHERASLPKIAAAAGECICIRGARMHNLRNVDLDIPRDRLVVITGPSGSGKSSLAFDTLYAEGQRQYIESLSIYARQFLRQLERPDVDLIEGLQPTISIDQRAGAHNPRSTVATVTEAYDYLRLLYARLGEASCCRCGAAIRQQTPEADPRRPAVAGRGDADHGPGPAGPRPQGGAPRSLRARAQGRVPAGASGRRGRRRQRTARNWRRQKAHHIEAVIDRVVVREGVRSRLAESINLAVRHGDGLVHGQPRGEAGAGQAVWRDELFSTQYACPDCKVGYEELEPRTFSFNSPYGACPACEGLGSRVAFDPDLIAAAAGAFAGRGGDRAVEGRFAGRAAAIEELPPAVDGRRRTALVHAAGEAEAEGAGATAARRRRRTFPACWSCWRRNTPPRRASRRRQRLEAFRGEVRLRGVQGGPAAARGPRRALRRPGDPRSDGPDRRRRAAILRLVLAARRSSSRSPGRSCAKSSARLDFLDNVGLEYLTLDRPAGTLSGGELQRVRLASGLGSGLVGVCYVLDEPSIGLHPRDNRRLIAALRNLQSRGNTVVVVEHDETIMRQADWLVDLGPAAGRHGGRVVAQGTPAAGGRGRLPDRPMTWPAGERIAHAGQRRRVAASALDHHRRRDGQQPQGRDRAVPALGAGVRHRA